jgi:SAM-dependent methyltransferase
MLPSGLGVGMVDPYAQIPSFYDAEFAGATADISTYFRDLSGARRVLVLGCGTGRVSDGLVHPGREVVGVDLSGPMIDRAGAASRDGTAHYRVGDMCHLAGLGLGLFDAVVIPNAAFSFLPSRRAQLQCLQQVRGMLEGGPLWIDVPMPDFELLGTPHSPEAPAWQGQVGDVQIRRTREVFRRPVAQQLLLRDRYYAAAGEAAPPICVSDLPLRLIFPAELEWLLESAGFYADTLYGNHAGGPLAEGCDRLLCRAL